MDTISFELGEDVRSEARILQDLSWSKAVADGRKHISHREAYIAYGFEFRSAIINYHILKMLCRELQRKSSPLFLLNSEILRHIIDYALPGQGPLVTAIVSALEQKIDIKHKQPNINYIPFRICARKRPLLPFEREIGAYDVVHATHSNNQIVLHDGRLARNGRRLTMTHQIFKLDKIWNERTSNDTVCNDEIKPLLSRIQTGNDATLICYGQTGTGKTHTLMGALEYISQNIIGSTIKLKFFEIHGKQCYDLLNNRNPVKLLSDHNENIQIQNIQNITLHVVEPADLKNILEVALTLRSSEVTERNPISSRSHAICSIEFIEYSNTYINYDVMNYNKN
eukprot:gene10238-21354_t